MPPTQEISEVLLRVRIDSAAAQNALRRLVEIDGTIRAMGETGSKVTQDMRRELGRIFADISLDKEIASIAKNFARLREEGVGVEEAFRKSLRPLETVINEQIKAEQQLARERAIAAAAQDDGRKATDAEIATALQDVNVAAIRERAYQKFAQTVTTVEEALARLEARQQGATAKQGGQALNLGFAEGIQRAQFDQVTKDFIDMREAGFSLDKSIAAARDRMLELGATQDEIRQLGVQLGRLDEQFKRQQSANTRPAFNMRFREGLAGAQRDQQLGAIEQQARRILELGGSLDDVIRDATETMFQLGAVSDTQINKVVAGIIRQREELERLRGVTVATTAEQLRSSVADQQRAAAITRLTELYQRLRAGGMSAADAEAEVADQARYLGAQEGQINGIAQGIARFEDQLRDSAITSDRLNDSLNRIGKAAAIQQAIANFQKMASSTKTADKAAEEFHKELLRIGATAADLPDIERQMMRGGRGGSRWGQSFHNVQLRTLGRIGQEIFYLPDIGPSTEISRALRLFDVLDQKIKELGGSAGQSAGLLGVGVAALTLLTIAVIQFNEALDRSKASLSGALDANREYYENLTTLTENTARQRLAALREQQPGQQLRLTQLQEALDEAFRQGVERNTNNLSLIAGPAVADFFTRLQDFIGQSPYKQLRDDFINLQKEIDKTAGSIGYLERGLAGTDFAANTAAEEVQRNQRIGFEVAQFGRTASLEQFNERVAATAAEIQSLTDANALLAEQATLAAAEQHILNDIRIEELQVTQALLSTQREFVEFRQRELDAQELIASDVGKLQAAYQQFQQLQSLITTGTVDQINEQIEAYQEQQRTLPGLIAQLESLGNANPAVKAAIATMRAELDSIPGAIGSLQFALPDAEIRDADKATADYIQTLARVRREAEEFAQSASPEQLQKRIDDLTASNADLSIEYQQLKAQQTEYADGLAAVLFARMEETGLLINFLEHLRGANDERARELALEDAQIEARNAYVKELEDQRDLELELADLLESGTSEAIDERVAALQREREAMLADLHELENLAAAHEDQEAAYTALEEKIDDIEDAINGLLGIRTDVVEREGQEDVSRDIAQRTGAQAEAFETALNFDSMRDFEDQLNDLDRQIRNLNDVNRALTGRTDAVATETIRLNEERIKELGYLHLFLSAYRSFVQGRVDELERLEAEQEARELAVQQWEDMIQLEHELAELVRTGTVEQLGDRIASLKEERDILLANLPTLREMAETSEEAEERLKQAERELASFNDEIARLEGISFEVATNEFQRESQKLWDDLQKDLAQIDERFSQQLLEASIKLGQEQEDALTDRNDKLADLQLEVDEKEIDAEEKKQDALIKLAEDTARQRAKIERDFQLSARAAIGRRDALALHEAQERRRQELADLRDREKERRKEIENSYREQLEEIEDNLEKQRRAIEIDYQRRLRDLNTQNQRQTAAIRAQWDRERSLRVAQYNDEYNQLRYSLFNQFALWQQFFNAMQGLVTRRLSDIVNAAYQAFNVPIYFNNSGTGTTTGPIYSGDNPYLQEGGLMTRTGEAVVHAGEAIGPVDRLADMFYDAVRKVDREERQIPRYQPMTWEAPYEPRVVAQTMVLNMPIQVEGSRFSREELIEAVIDHVDQAFEEAGWNDDD